MDREGLRKICFSVILAAVRGFPPLPASPWAPGETPHGQSVDLTEYPSALRRLRKCRSFRADLRHKLEIIVQAHGGWGTAGVNLAAARLCVSRWTLRRWAAWQLAPGSRLAFERIDNAYDEALEALAARVCSRKGRVSPRGEKGVSSKVAFTANGTARVD